MKENDRYRVNKPNVILEDFGDEVVIVNLASGNYYSVDALGAEIWTLIQKGATATEISAHLSCAYEGTIAIIEQAVTRFIQEMLSENLVIPDSGVSAQPPKLNDAISPVRKPFVSPVLNKYTDMQELLLIDPIHEVDETGWPNIADPVPGPTPESQE